MAYIWEDYKEENQFQVTDDNVSPYMEVWDKKGEIVPVNVFVRLYPYLFPESFVRDEASVNELLNQYGNSLRYEETANLLMHYIARLDRIKGLSLVDIVKFRIYRDIRQGAYGLWLREAFCELEQEKQWMILRYAAEYNLSGQRVTVYDAAVKQVFETVSMYYEKSSKITYLYIGKQRNEANERLLQIVDYLFKDINIKTEVMWQGEHFGIIGMDQTMRIGELALI